MPTPRIQRRKPDDMDSTTTTHIRPHQCRFDNHDASSTTPQVGIPQRQRPDDADSTTTTQIRPPRPRFDNHNMSLTTTPRIRQLRHGFDDNNRDHTSHDNDADRGMWASSFSFNGERSEIDRREGNQGSGGMSRIYFTLSSPLTTLIPHPVNSFLRAQ